MLFAAKTTFNDIGEYNHFKSINKLMGKNTNRVFYLPAPVDSDIFKPKDRLKLRKKLKLPINQKIVIFVGRITYGKCSDILIDLIKNNKDILFIVVGRVMDDNFTKLKANNFIHYEKKSSEELSDYYNAADLGFFLHRQINAGLGLTTQESLSCGTPAIVPFREGIKEINGLYQIEVSKSHTNKVVKDFFKLDKKKVDEMSSNVRKFILDNYSGHAVKKDYLRAFAHF